jgi:hypothetical protein
MTTPTPPAQPDVDRLAAAIEDVRWGWEETTETAAAALLTHPDMQQWAAEAALGRALTRLPNDRSISLYAIPTRVDRLDNRKWRAVLDGDEYHVGYGPTLEAAIAAALGEDGA